MAGDTQITVIGNLAADPEEIQGRNGRGARFSILSTPSTYNRQTNSWDNGETLSMRCIVWDSGRTTLASNILASLSKGTRVIAQGNLVQNSYETSNGERRYSVELRVTEIGPALTRNTAQVTRVQSAGGGFQNGRGGFAGSSSNANSNGYQSGLNAAPNYSAQTPAADPFASSPSTSGSNPYDFGSSNGFGSNDDFGSDEDIF